MDALGTEIGRWLITQGMFAIISGVLAWRLYQREGEITAINAARLAENRESMAALTESTATLRQVAEAQAKAAEWGRSVTEALRALEAEIERGRR